jgi:hypothetical protein
MINAAKIQPEHYKGEQEHLLSQVRHASPLRVKYHRSKSINESKNNKREKRVDVQVENVIVGSKQLSQVA